MTERGRERLEETNQRVKVPEGTIGRGTNPEEALPLKRIHPLPRKCPKMGKALLRTDKAAVVRFIRAHRKSDQSKESQSPTSAYLIKLRKQLLDDLYLIDCSFNDPIQNCVDKWMCCCGFHMTAAALVIAWIWLLSAISMVPSFFISVYFQLYYQTFNAYAILNIVSTILLIAQSVPIIVGEMRGKRTHKMYLPFLVISGIQLAFTMIGGIVIFFTLDQMRQQMGGYSTGVIIGYFFGLLLVLFIFFWCYSIVYRAYKFVKEKNDEKKRHNAKDIQI
ncbi:hypothetical protein niasHS_015443 [Heterodera schachtii]|uniref:Uncharacterized protein n=1 Tax=Heterodera schachtii TaxID=97005 RepID=A0ABD2HW05_HETSC